MNSEKRVGDIENNYQNNFRNYNLCLKRVPRLAYDDPEVDALILQGQPVIITGSELVASASKWTLDYLRRAIGNHRVNVMVSKNHNFKFFDEVLRKRTTKDSPPIKIVTMKFTDFLRRFQEWKPGENRLYMQNLLVTGIGPSFVEDFKEFKWDWVEEKQKKYGWSPLSANLLLLAMEGNVTTCHFDEQHNLFAQIHGYKRCILFPPSQYECLYTYPVHHPCDRQCQVDFENPDFEKFPKFQDIQDGMEAFLGPGDVLYIPSYWFHHIEAMLNGGHTLSITFWFKDTSREVEFPLKDFQKLKISRNIEKVLLEALNDPKEVGAMLKAMLFGRYT